MFIKIPFESVIDFKTNISEITKMSLEHDFNVNDGVVLGNFYISGEYRIHAVSINIDSFNYTLPFTVELRDDINKDTVEFNIEDFSYDIVNGNTLKVNIEYSLKAEVREIEEDEEEVLFKRVDEEELESELAFIDNFLEENLEEEEKQREEAEFEEDIDEVIEDVVEEVKDLEEKIEEVEEKIVETRELREEVKTLEEEEEGEEERVSLEEEKTIMDTIKDGDDTFVTYHIHIVKEAETIDSICALYGVTNSLVSEYNNVNGITTGDKILIPKIDE